MAGRRGWHRPGLVAAATFAIATGVVGRWAWVDRRPAHGYAAVRLGASRERVAALMGEPDDAVPGRFALGGLTWDYAPLTGDPAKIGEQLRYYRHPAIVGAYCVGLDATGHVVARHVAN